MTRTLEHTDVLAILGPALRRVTGIARAPLGRAVVDSRLCQTGDLFVALPGEHVDGAAYVEDALARGATAVLATRTPATVPAGCAVYETGEPLAALQRLAAGWRERFDVRVLAITGTVGKTSTKEIAAQVLGRRYALLKNEGNLNGDIGLPLVLLNLRAEHEAAVLEMGMYAEGEIRLQCELARPRWGIITNVGYTHAARLGGIEAIARAKGELAAWLPPEATLALNADDPYVAQMAERARCRVVHYSAGGAADVRAVEVEEYGLDGIGFTIEARGARAHVRTPLIGRHNAGNCLAVTAIGLADGMSLDEIAEALARATNPLRLTVYPGPNGSTLIDDRYNASPASVAAALDVLARAPGRRRIAVLGQMAELGEAEERLHRAAGEQAARTADLIFTVGPLARWLAEAARAAGHGDVRHTDEKIGLAEAVIAEARPGDVILIKGARGLALESVVEMLRAAPASAGA